MEGDPHEEHQPDELPPKVQLPQEELSAEYAPGTGNRVRKAAIIGGALLGLAFLGVWIDRALKQRQVASFTEASAAQRLPVDVVVAAPVTGAQRLELPGQAAAWHASTIFARVNGYVAQWYVDIGDHVTQGELLAQLETPELDAQAAAARAQLASARAQVAVQRAAAELARSTYERWRDSPPGVVSEQERQEKRADEHGAEARLAAAQADVALDEARVQQHTALAQFKKVTAPYSGVITERAIDIGNLVSAGSTADTTPLYVMTQNDPMRVYTDVPQSAAAELMEPGVGVRVQMPGSQRAYEGRVARTAQALNPQARTLRVEVDVANADGQLVPGMYVTVGFDLKPQGTVEIPAAALLLRAEGPQVARVGADGKVSFQDVTIARDHGSLVELGAGASPGDRLVLNPSSQIMAGQAVDIHSVHPTRLAETGPAAAPGR